MHFFIKKKPKQMFCYLIAYYPNGTVLSVLHVYCEFFHTGFPGQNPCNACCHQTDGF